MDTNMGLEVYKNWGARVDGKSSIHAMLYIRALYDGHQKQLKICADVYNERMDQMRKNHMQKEKSIRESAEKDILSANNQMQAQIVQVQTQKEKDYNLINAAMAESAKEALPKEGIGRAFEVVFGGAEAKKRAYQAAQERAQEASSNLEHTCTEKENQIKMDTRIRIQRIKKTCEIDLSKKKEEYTSEINKQDAKYKADVANIEASFQRLLREGVDAQVLKQYLQSISATIPSTSEYVCADAVPEFVCLGDVSMEVTERPYQTVQLAQTILEEAGTVVRKNEGTAVEGRLPYCQRLEDGISLLVKYAPAEKNRHQDHLRMLLLKLFMTFPAGKMEATMIDPVELGETFSLFTKLGEEQERIIDTKIWSQEKDITVAINVLRQKLETMTQSYGSDKDARLKNEPVRILAITDFPTGFTKNALQDLQAIIRKSAAYGICIFIWANEDEYNHLPNSQQVYMNTTLQEARASGNVITLSNVGAPSNVKLHLDTVPGLQERSASIIDILANGIHGARQKIVDFVNVFEDIDNPSAWFAQETIDELSIPIGMRGANSVVKMTVGRTDGSTAHHMLVAGQTGSGKSTLLHTIIMSTLLNYDPDEVQMYLVDFKEGVAFKSYSKFNLPSIRVVAIDCEPEFGLNILKELKKEMDQRFEQFRREAEREEISQYRKKTGKSIPKLLVIIDEVQELFLSGRDEVVAECHNLLRGLLTLGRAAGIHFVLASQDFNQLSDLKSMLFAHAAIRIAIKGSENSARSVLGDGNKGAEQLVTGGPGSAVFNTDSGKESANVIFQIAHLESALRDQFLKRLALVQNDPLFAQKYDTKTRILSTSAEDDVFNQFNQMILQGQAPAQKANGGDYVLTMGEGFEMKRKFAVELETEPGSNLLLVGNNEDQAASMFYFMMLSLLYCNLQEVGEKKRGQLIYLIDLSVEDDKEYAASFTQMEARFGNQVQRETLKNMNRLIDQTYETMLRRMDGQEESDKRLFLMIFGVNRAHKLGRNDAYEKEWDGSVSTQEKLMEILKRGAKLGIHTILWGETLSGTERIIGKGYSRDCSKRVAFSTDTATLETLVEERTDKILRASTAVYMNIETDLKNTRFRPYEVPAKVWIDKFAQVYQQIRDADKA